MRPLLCALAGLALLRAAGALAAAEPFSPPQGDAAQSTACDRHMAVQRRLDVMEEVNHRMVWKDMWAETPPGGGATKEMRAPACKVPKGRRW
ncbi:placenta-specific protein 9 isoform X3 [Cebus imitator]|uniref:placenta-specific protein 9 isoform X3 n=1 Tax=Cebus imitator TaxID=2715852 RepID=UPI00189A3B02|nr:placenta-specific protein 9 isoform X3 [Cebus imitator]